MIKTCFRFVCCSVPQVNVKKTFGGVLLVILLIPRMHEILVAKSVAIWWQSLKKCLKIVAKNAKLVKEQSGRSGNGFRRIETGLGNLEQSRAENFNSSGITG
jgi:hypothetical protein